MLQKGAKGSGGDICKRCISRHCAMQVEGGLQECTCAMPGCNHTLDERVILSLHNSKNLKQMLEANQMREGRDVRLAFYEDSPEVLTWGEGRSQLCPYCYTLVEKRAGCDHMTCSCKKEFWYCCGIPFRATTPEMALNRHHEACHGRNSSDGTPIFNPNVGALAELKKRRIARRLAFASGTHGRLGAASAVRMLPVEIVQKVVAGV